MVDISGGEGANRGFWREQLRDRFGRFVEMFGEVIIEISLPGVQGTVRARGRFIGNSELGVARIEILDNSEIPKGIYLVKHSDITAAPKEVARLSEKFLDEKNIDSGIVDGTVGDPLKSAISGDNVLKTRLKTVAKILKGEGRFPIPRLPINGQIGKTSDLAKGAKADYKKVFDAEPALQEKYKTSENMWETVFNYSADASTQSPNELAEIPEDMKELNRAYAKNVLGLEPEGLVTFYRNAINYKDTPEESAIGYVSLDRNLAYDYNSNKPNERSNGRYEIDAKPAEVFGMLGYSKIEDEYSVTIGREVTSTPDRVRRVGDLEIVDIEAPWLKDFGREFARGTGLTPFRGFNAVAEFDFHPVEPLGDSLDDFLKKNDIAAGDIKAMFEKLYGEGSYEKYKSSGNNINYNMIRDMFVPLEDGRIGLDAKKLATFDELHENSAAYVGDRYDNLLKMLSVFQEITQQPFMTHKSRDYRPSRDSTDQVSEPTEAGTADIVGSGIENWLPIMADILKSTEDSESEDNNFDPELGNKRLSTVMEMAGYNAKPRVVGTEEFDSIEGKTLYRGVNDEKFIDQYKNSPKHFAGQGNFGNGTYSTDSKATSMQYGGSSDNNILEFKLSSDANIQRFNSRRELLDWMEETVSGIRENYSNSGVSNDEYYEFIRQMDNTADWTNLAVMLGIDAIEFPPSSALEERYTIILNRGKVIINDKS